MHFTNLPIPIEALAKSTEVHLNPLEKEYLQVQQIVLFINTTVWLTIGTVGYYFIKSLQALYIILPAAIILVILLVVSWVTTRLSFMYSGYALREKDVLYRSGWFNRKTRVVPLNRIQHVSVQSGPLERRYGLASVSIFTAGEGQADFTIQGITHQTALQIKDWITDQLHGRTTKQ